MATVTADGIKWEYLDDECPTMQEWWAFNFTGHGPAFASKMLRQVMGRALMLRKLQAFRKEIGMGPLSPGAFYLLQKYAPNVLTGDL